MSEAKVIPDQPVVGEKLYQDLDPELRRILGMMCFECIRTAAALRLLGHEIPKRAEDEQAATLNWLLGLYAKNGTAWRSAAIAILKKADADAAAAPPQGAGEP